MINKLRKKFTTLATVSMLVLMALLVLIMNIVNYTSVVIESNEVIDVLSKQNSHFANISDPPEIPGKDEGGEKAGDSTPPEKPESEDKEEGGETDEPEKNYVPVGMSPEVPYESRFFMVMVSSDGKIRESDLSRIVSVDEESVEEYIDGALESKRDSGFIGQFRYSKSTSERGTKIIFLDCGRKLDAFKTFLFTSIGVGMLGCLIVFVAFLLVSGRIVKPIAESYEKQKRFISDAGHEIKTPLTIISANVDLLECDGEKEELSEIRQQIGSLTELTNGLVYLSKMEEAEHTVQKIKLSLSDMVNEMANSFRAPASAKRLNLDVKVADGISLTAEPDSIHRLISILLDNAVKYSPEGEKIEVELTTGRKNAVFTVGNRTVERIESDALPCVFDRFYRTDASRNSETGGHGIGLSVAKAITEAHGGSISASTKTGNDFIITVNLPL